MAFFMFCIVMGSASVAPTGKRRMLGGGAKREARSKRWCELEWRRPSPAARSLSLAFTPRIDRRRTHSDGTFNFLNPSAALVSGGVSSKAFLKFLTAQSWSPAVTQASPRLS